MKKSQLKGLLLTLLFGPVGLFYSSVRLALALTALAVLIVTVDVGTAMLIWPLSIVVGVFTVKKHNSNKNVKEKKVKKSVEGKAAVEELADFRIAPSPKRTDISKKGSKNDAKWINPGDTVKVGKSRIRNGFFYFGGQMNGAAGFHGGDEASLVNPDLRIDAKSPDYAGDQMSYWPRYSRISPQSRAAYIEWLAGDRSDPEAYIGYVFLYFFGIERRLLVDDANGQVSDDERKELVRELKRLKSVYGDHHSFRSYVNDLLSHVWVFRNRMLDEEPDYELLVAKRGFTSAFKFLLAERVQRGEPVEAELALAWVRSHPEFTLRTPARRCPNEFDELFRLRYKSKFGAGLKLSPNKTRLQLDYQPASASLRGYYNLRLDLPDVSRLMGPVRKLVSLAESCTTELDQFSRFVGRHGNSRDSLKAFSLLPNDLIAFVSNPQFEKFKSWMQSQVPESCTLVPVDSLLQHFGEDSPLKINKREAELLSSLVEKAGYGVAPDFRFHHAKPDIDGKIVLFPGGHGESFSPSGEFRKVGTILRLGTLVAATDDHVSDSEVKALKDVISQNSRLTDTERRSLNAYMMWRLNSPSNMTGLKKRLGLLSPSEKVAISHILVGVALADGKIDPAEIRQLEKLYTQLGLDKSLVASDIHNLSSSRSQRSDQAAKSSSTPSTQHASTFALDRDLVRLLEEETKEAQSVLESIFAEEDHDDETIIEMPTVVPANIGSTEGLDTKVQEIYGRLITKAEWTNEELEELCSERQLMSAGAVESINDWAFDRVGAPLIEEGSTVFVDLDLAEEISTMQIQEQMP